LVFQAPANLQRNAMLSIILAIVLILWLLGFALHIGGALIHVLLVIALFVLVLNLITGRRSAL
jgi:hypothetical protein